jgi:DNA (cytosine-5)-methyltransferase 1
VRPALNKKMMKSTSNGEFVFAKDEVSEIDIPEITLKYISNSNKSISVQIINSKDAVEILRKLIPMDEIELREQVVVLYLNNSNKVIGYYRHTTGGITSSIVDKRLILATALKSLCTSIILCHNHPSGGLKPSDADIKLTSQLKHAAKQMEIDLIDHIILTRDEYYSFADKGDLSLAGIKTEKDITYLDLFSGTGGFAKGLQNAGFNFKTHYYSEIDKYSVANYQYNFRHAKNLGDITKIKGQQIQRPTIISFGSPCQDISIAGKFKGIKGKRSSLFFEAVRIIRECRPEVFIFENVKGLFSSNQGKDFEVVLRSFADIGLYDCQWQLLNTCWFLPQNRERIYLVGYLRGKATPQIFPFAESDQGNHAFDKKEPQRKTISPAIDTKVGESSHRSPYILHWKNSTTKWVKEKMQNSPALKAQSDLVRQPLIVSGAAYRTRNYKGEGGKIELRKDKIANQLTTVQKDSMVLFHVPEATRKGYATAAEGDSINLSFLEANKRRGRVGKAIANTIDTAAQQFTLKQGNLRRLTPIECERLQGFPDNWTMWGLFDGEIKEISDSQRYKMLGNAVSVPVVEAIANRLQGKVITQAIIKTDEKILLLTLELELELLNVKHAA